MESTFRDGLIDQLARVALAAAALFLLSTASLEILSADTLNDQVLLQAYLAVGPFLCIPVGLIINERRRLKLALSSSERQLQLMTEGSPAGLLRCGLDGSPLYVNARWIELTGLGLAEIRNHGWEKLVVEIDRSNARELWRQARGNLQGASDCLRCELVGRAMGWAEFTITPERDPAGAVVGWVIRLIDMSEQMAAIAGLKEIESLYRLLAENSRDIIMRVALDGTNLFVSGAAQSMLGIGPESMVGKSLGGFIHRDDWPFVEDGFKALVKEDGGQSLRYRMRRANGRYLWVEAAFHLVRDSTSGIPVEFVASVRDIDLRQRAEAVASEAARKLRESNRLLTMAEGLATVGHWRFDRSTGMVELSPQARVLAGLEHKADVSPAEAMGIVDPGDRWRVKRALIAANKRRATAHCPIRIARPDGQDRFLDLAVQSEREGTGAEAGLFGVVHDVSKKVADERQLVDALADARAAADAKSVFLATMSHEIRTPMTGVLGMIDLLLDNPPEQDRANFLDTLKQSASLLMAVLNDVLDFSKMEQGRVELHSCDFDFEALAQNTLDLFFNAASQKGLLITLALDAGNSPFVHGDPVRIQQVMSNLINNAIKFTDAGNVTVRIKARPGKRGTQIWRVEVRDTGIGINAANIDNLFDPFMQAASGARHRASGTGLGLAISRRLVDAMGGAMGVDSKPKRGSTFWFEVTLDEALCEPVRARPTRAAALAVRPLKLLVAEDNPVNQLLITALLRRQGHLTTCVNDGLSAVDAACADRFDCILMDMQMPVMDGITATRTIRQSSGPCADVPIIALTADASPERRRFYDNAGLTDFMTKPIDGNALADLLSTIAMAESAPAAAAPIDQQHLKSLRAALGPTRLKALLELFVAELDHRPDSLREHLLAGRLDQARAEAHSLKGAAMSVGATALGDAALAIEQQAVPSDIKVNSRLIDAMDQAVEALRAELGAPFVDEARSSGSKG